MPTLKKILKIFLVAGVFLGISWYMFQQYYIYKTPGAHRGFMAPPLQILCKYEEGLSISRYATADPKWQPNNKFGIYVYAEVADFFELAQNLVNSNGGSW